MSRAIGPWSSISNWGCRFLRGTRARRPTIFAVRTAFVLTGNGPNSEAGSGTCCPEGSTCCASGCTDSQASAISLRIVEVSLTNRVDRTRVAEVVHALLAMAVAVQPHVVLQVGTVAAVMATYIPPMALSVARESAPERRVLWRASYKF